MTTRTDYLNKVETRLKLLNAEIDKLKARAEEAKAEAKVEYQKHVEALSTRYRVVENRFHELKQAKGNSWETIQPHLEIALNTLYDEFANAERTARKFGHQPLGWAEGLAKDRPHDSEGWAEGMGKKGPDSEGWAEGLGHQTKDSEGWPEGMAKR